LRGSFNQSCEVGETELVLATVIEALALFVRSATLVAVIVCAPAVAGHGTCPRRSIGPVSVFPPAMASTDQVTAVLVVPVTVAVNCAVVPAGTFVDGLLDCHTDLEAGEEEEGAEHRELKRLDPFRRKATANNSAETKRQRDEEAFIAQI
jgi:hypothetical protein